MSSYSEDSYDSSCMEVDCSGPPPEFLLPPPPPPPSLPCSDLQNIRRQPHPVTTTSLSDHQWLVTSADFCDALVSTDRASQDETVGDDSNFFTYMVVVIVSSLILVTVILATTAIIWR